MRFDPTHAAAAAAASHLPPRSLSCCCFCGLLPHTQQVRDEQAEAQSVASVVAAEEAEVAAKAAQCKALKDDAAAELVGAFTQAVALPVCDICSHTDMSSRVASPRVAQCQVIMKQESVA